VLQGLTLQEQVEAILGNSHMSKQCTKPKRKRDDSWFKDKVLDPLLNRS
ncbi:hypothetical protein Tco_0887758, partial [Tanacetum coccineum]